MNVKEIKTPTNPNPSDQTSKSKFRWTISIQIYLALATFVLLILLASLLGWISILQMNNIQKTITEERIPKLSLAIKMGQESMALMNTAPKLLSASSDEDIAKIATSIQEGQKKLSKILQKIKSSTSDDKTGTVFDQYESLSQGFINNINLLKKSVETTLHLKKKLKALLNQALQKTRNINRDLLSEIDNQTFFLYTGWRTLGQKKPLRLSVRAGQDSLNYYRSLLSLKALSQLASNQLNEAAQIIDPDLIQPLQERFQATLGNCKQALHLMKNKAFKNKIFKQINVLEGTGRGRGPWKSTLVFLKFWKKFSKKGSCKTNIPLITKIS